jgi:hypothetical protein
MFEFSRSRIFSTAMNVREIRNGFQCLSFLLYISFVWVSRRRSRRRRWSESAEVRRRSRRRRIKNLGKSNSNMVARGRMRNGSLWWKGRWRCCCCLTQFGGSEFVRKISFGGRIWNNNTVLFGFILFFNYVFLS